MEEEEGTHTMFLVGDRCPTLKEEEEEEEEEEKISSHVK
jgi:hypothetical protein